MATNLNNDIDDRKLDIIKVRVLEMEADNIVKKETKSSMVEKVYRLIMTEVDKR